VRLRFKYSKTGAAAFLGHLEMLRFWQRALRRAGLPLAYSKGFNPHPRLAFGPALAVGVESLAEYLDAEFTQAVNPEEIKKRAQAQLPAGLELLLVKPVPAGARALTAVIEVAAYQASWLLPPDTQLLQSSIEALLARQEVNIIYPGREGEKVKDIRPGIFKLELTADNNLEMLLETSSKGSVRPEQVITALDLHQPHRIIRTGLFIRSGSVLLTPEEVI
jgi:radical SAM-linked protein